MNQSPSLRPETKCLHVLGSTGTIGQNTLNIASEHPERFEIATLTAGDNVALLAEQARKFKPQRAVIANADLYGELKSLLSGTDIEVSAGEDAVCEAAAMPADITMSAIVGLAGLKPTLSAIRNGHTIALANKECLVSAGSVMKKEIARCGATVIPVDSEHNAIFQLIPSIETSTWQAVRTLTITASGGPFRTFTSEQMQNITPEQAVRHPNWNMGAKISVDSATLMNKGLELIEAYQLFPVAPSQLQAIIHPQSIIHCLVHMLDGSVLAQMSNPDMRTPIACALAWPERIHAPVHALDLAAIGTLQFEQPDTNRFPALALAKSALEAGGNAPTILNAANEVAVQRFLKKEIGFLDIAKTVEKTLQTMDNAPLNSLDDVLHCDNEARLLAKG